MGLRPTVRPTELGKDWRAGQGVRQVLLRVRVRGKSTVHGSVAACVSASGGALRSLSAPAEMRIHENVSNTVDFW
eukprot:12910877-Prorocentrum_lima.AAC.1